MNIWDLPSIQKILADSTYDVYLMRLFIRQIYGNAAFIMPGSEIEEISGRKKGYMYLDFKQHYNENGEAVDEDIIPEDMFTSEEYEAYAKDPSDTSTEGKAVLADMVGDFRRFLEDTIVIYRRLDDVSNADHRSSVIKKIQEYVSNSDFADRSVSHVSYSVTENLNRMIEEVEETEKASGDLELSDFLEPAASDVAEDGGVPDDLELPDSLESAAPGVAEDEGVPDDLEAEAGSAAFAEDTGDSGGRMDEDAGGHGHPLKYVGLVARGLLSQEEQKRINVRSDGGDAKNLVEADLDSLNDTSRMSWSQNGAGDPSAEIRAKEENQDDPVTRFFYKHDAKGLAEPGRLPKGSVYSGILGMLDYMANVRYKDHPDVEYPIEIKTQTPAFLSAAVVGLVSACKSAAVARAALANGKWVNEDGTLGEPLNSGQTLKFTQIAASIDKVSAFVIDGIRIDREKLSEASNADSILQFIAAQKIALARRQQQGR
ncbi:MAG: hypothetical protein LBO78_03040 [Rickettsiales bacterium]|jgi:hypothetical protein|nr:hypothetical protein [Rickettsiales bacterium]